jgi:hypothetical protein
LCPKELWNEKNVPAHDDKEPPIIFSSEFFLFGKRKSRLLDPRENSIWRIPGCFSKSKVQSSLKLPTVSSAGLKTPGLNSITVKAK